MEQATVLIISDDAEFSGALMARWQQEPASPGFTLMRGDLCHALDPDTFDIAIVGPVKAGTTDSILRSLESLGKPAVIVSGEVTQSAGSTIVVPRNESWLETLTLVSAQVLARHLAEREAREVAEAHASAEREATLGRYMLETRHSLNNALTSILGNSELLLLDPRSLGREARQQVETIRDMSLRIHEALRRFSSLDKELNVVAKMVRKPRTARAAG